MHCYLCGHTVPGGTRYAIREAIGICHQCGIGVCEQHAEKQKKSGAPLLCTTCATVASEAELESASR